MARPLPHHIGAYRVDGLLGRGASGVVYRAWDESLDRPVAIKVLTDLDPEARGRFTIEAKAAARIVHPNVVQVHGVGTHEDDAFITQELVDGHPLSTVLEAGRTLGAAAAIDVAIQVAEGLAAAEAVGVLHRDIKPHNLLVTHDGLVKIADFGLAKILDAPSSYTADGTTLGTPHYMSPEQGQGKTLDARSDQYALGASLYHLLAGAPPFDADTAVATIYLHTNEPLPSLAERAPDCPQALVAIVERTLAKDPADRFDSLTELVDALAELATGDGDLAEVVADAVKEEVQPPPSSPNRARLERFALAATAMVAVGVIAAATKPSPTLEKSGATRVAAPAIEIPVVPLDDARDPFVPDHSVGVTVAQPAPAPKKNAPSVRGYIRTLKRGGARAVKAAQALGEQNDQRATMPLIDALASDDVAVAVAAAEALGRLGDIRAIEPLADAAKDASSGRVRDAAAAAHKRLWHVEE